jgi:N-acetylglucosaminyl-diphospho-decaprenol L-rhamnosyltransferase
MVEITESSGVSIVIPHYGDPLLSRELIEALREQSTHRPLQIIVVDDHFPEAFPELDIPGFEVVRRNVNGGFGATVNTGAKVAVHPLLLILNSDLTIGPDFVDDLCSGAAPWMPAIVSPTVVDHHGASQYTGRRFPTISGSAIASLVPLARWRDDVRWHRAVGHEIPDPSSDAMICDWFVGAVILIPTDEFHRLGGFDERFYMNSEEVDLQRRAREFNLPSVVLSQVIVEHVGGGSSDDAKRFLWLMQGEWRYRRKWNGSAGARTFQATLVGTCVINLIWNSARALLGRPTHPLRTFRNSVGAVLRASSH